MPSPAPILILCGSPRPHGDTASLAELFIKNVGLPCRTVNPYRLSFSPCIDCRRCRDTGKCVIRDGMDEVYPLIERASGIVIASPIHYTELTGPLLSLVSRMQCYFSASFFLHRPPSFPERPGGIILTGGGNGTPDRAAATARLILRESGCTPLPPVISHDTDHIPAAEDEAAVRAVLALAASFRESITARSSESRQK